MPGHCPSLGPWPRSLPSRLATHHAGPEGPGVPVHHRRELSRGRVEGRDQTPHGRVHVLELPPPVRHQAGHAGQRGALGTVTPGWHAERGSPPPGPSCPSLTMAALAAVTEPPPGAAERAPTSRTKACRGLFTRLCSGPSAGTRYLQAGEGQGRVLGRAGVEGTTAPRSRGSFRHDSDPGSDRTPPIGAASGVQGGAVTTRSPVRTEHDLVGASLHPQPAPAWHRRPGVCG